MGNNVPKYYVRFSRAADMAELMEFYKNNHHPAIATRTRDLVEQLVANGSAVLIEDDKGKIVAASISYPITVEENGIEKAKWVEIGSTRIATGGYPGFFNAMIAAQILRTFMVEPPTDRWVAEMPDPPVQALARGLGWRPWQNPSVEMVKRSYEILQSKKEEGYEHWFQQGVEGLPHIARFLLNAIANPVLTHRKTGEKIELSFEKCRMVSMFDKEMADLAKSDFGDIEKPDMKAGLYGCRQKWLRNIVR